MGLEYNWCALACAIAAPTFCCVEKAFAFMDGPTPKGRTNKNRKRKRLQATDWVTDELLAEMSASKKKLGNRKAAALYGFDESSFSRMVKKYEMEVGA